MMKTKICCYVVRYITNGNKLSYNSAVNNTFAMTLCYTLNSSTTIINITFVDYNNNNETK